MPLFIAGVHFADAYRGGESMSLSLTFTADILVFSYNLASKIETMSVFCFFFLCVYAICNGAACQHTFHLPSNFCVGKQPAVLFNSSGRWRYGSM
jgi:hypothetical protein